MSERFRFLHPARILIAGCSSSGKTTLIMHILKHLELFDIPPRKVFYVKKYNSLWHRDFPEVEFLDKIPDDWDERVPTLIVIDDNICEKDTLIKAEDLFVRKSHHKNASVILVTQSLFYNQPTYRTISLNASYVILMKNPRSQQQINTFGRQLYPGKLLPYFMDSYEQATGSDYGYLLVDLHATTHSSRRLRTGILPHERQFLFTPK